jgi:hypothetical protein
MVPSLRWCHRLCGAIAYVLPLLRWCHRCSCWHGQHLKPPTNARQHCLRLFLCVYMCVRTFDSRAFFIMRWQRQVCSRFRCVAYDNRLWKVVNVADRMVGPSCLRFFGERQPQVLSLSRCTGVSPAAIKAVLDRCGESAIHRERRTCLTQCSSYLRLVAALLNFATHLTMTVYVPCANCGSIAQPRSQPCALCYCNLRNLILMVCCNLRNLIPMVYRNLRNLITMVHCNLRNLIPIVYLDRFVRMRSLLITFSSDRVLFRLRPRLNTARYGRCGAGVPFAVPTSST